MERKPFNMRATTAFLVTAAFLLSGVTGLVLFAVPQGRIANWVDWKLIGLLREDWVQVHLVFGLLFLVFGVIHLFPYNWPTFKAYVAARTKGRLDFRKPRKEFVVSLAIAALLTVGAIAKAPPLNYLFDFNAWVKDAWVSGPDYQPPFGHAEELSLAGFAARMNMDLEAAMAALKGRGLAFAGPRESLGGIAKANGMSAMDLYMLIKPFERPAQAAPAATGAPAFATAEAIEAAFAGKGVGRKTLAAICAETGLDPADALARLRDAGLMASDGQTLKELADALGVTPLDVLKRLLLAPGVGG